MIDHNDDNNNNTAYFAGIDVGATATKAIIINDHSEVLGKAVQRSGVDLKGAAESTYRIALEGTGINGDAIKYSVATGYGRASLPEADIIVTEVSCQAQGEHFRCPRLAWRGTESPRVSA